MKKTILKAIIIISVITLIAVGAYFLLVALGLDNFETLKAVANDGWWGIIIFFFLQICRKCGQLRTPFNGTFPKINPTRSISRKER